MHGANLNMKQRRDKGWAGNWDEEKVAVRRRMRPHPMMMIPRDIYTDLLFGRRIAVARPTMSVIPFIMQVT
jgi:hypothetical protein